jgi:hypothetical protein
VSAPGLAQPTTITPLASTAHNSRIIEPPRDDALVVMVLLVTHNRTHIGM